MWHPIRLAEDYAMADIVTDGRIMMGVGRGYHTREVESFGAPLLDAEKNRDLFEEGVQLLLKCFNEQKFRHKGRFYEAPPPVPYRGYTVEDITMVPRPKHLPVDIYMPIASGKTIDLMAKYDFKAMVTLNGEKILDDVLRAYQAAFAKKGVQKKLGEDVIWGAGVYLAGIAGRGDPKARARARRALQVVRAVRIRPVCRRAGPRLGHARRAGERAEAGRRREAEGLVLRHRRRT